MTGKSAQRADATGRTSTRLKDAKALVDVGRQWIGHPRSLRESPSWRFLSWQARKLIDRLELEHMAEGGQKNGRLGVSYSQFVAAGISENCIPKAMVETFAACLVERTSKGGKAIGDYRPTSTYRLTYLPANGVITHEWHALRSIEEVQNRFDRLWAEWKQENPPRQALQRVGGIAANVQAASRKAS